MSAQAPFIVDPRRRTAAARCHITDCPLRYPVSSHMDNASGTVPGVDRHLFGLLPCKRRRFQRDGNGVLPDGFAREPRSGRLRGSVHFGVERLRIPARADPADAVVRGWAGRERLGFARLRRPAGLHVPQARGRKRRINSLPWAPGLDTALSPDPAPLPFGSGKPCAARPDRRLRNSLTGDARSTVLWTVPESR